MEVIVANFPYLSRAAIMTLRLAVFALALSTAVGLVGGILSIVGGRLLRTLILGYVYVIRGTPILVQIFLVYFGLPFFGIRVHASVVAIVAISLHMGGLMMEIVRGAVLAIPRGQVESGLALGMTPWLLVWQVLLPQAVRAAFPPYVSFLPVTIKATALASVINIWELTLASKEVANRTLSTFEIFGVAFAMYFLLCYPFTYLGSRLERRLTSYVH